MKTNAAVRLWRAMEARGLLEDYVFCRGVPNAYGEMEGEQKLCEARGYFSALSHRTNPYVDALVSMAGQVCEPRTPMMIVPRGSISGVVQGDVVYVQGKGFAVNSVDSMLDVYDLVSLTPTGKQQEDDHVEKSV